MPLGKQRKPRANGETRVHPVRKTQKLPLQTPARPAGVAASKSPERAEILESAPRLPSIFIAKAPASLFSLKRRPSLAVTSRWILTHKGDVCFPSTRTQNCLKRRIFLPRNRELCQGFRRKDTSHGQAGSCPKASTFSRQTRLPAAGFRDAAPALGRLLPPCSAASAASASGASGPPARRLCPSACAGTCAA